MARELQRHLLPVLLPGLLAAGGLIAVDHLLGSAAFGAAAIIAAVVANAGQSIELVRAKRIVGVSVLFLILAVVNQGLWLSWAILVPDIGTMIFATVTGTITVFNLIWWSLRMLGLRPLFGCRHSRSGATSHGSAATARRHSARPSPGVSPQRREQQRCDVDIDRDTIGNADHRGARRDRHPDHRRR
jgi:uncharacterized protein with PQ loop repeat